MNENIVGPRGKRVIYSRFFSGGIHKDDIEELEEFKQNCSKKGIKMNYNGKKQSCGWSILFKRNNKIERVLIPIANMSGIDVDIFIDEVIDELLDSIKKQCEEKELTRESESFKKSTVSKIISNVIKVNQK